jgi:CheY-like chemotaxis protein
MLKSLSVESVSVGSGLEALDAASHDSFRAVFMDIQMPGLDGYDTTKALREAGMRAPIVAYTGSSTLKNLNETGMTDVLQKPVDLARVKQLVEQFMQPL